MSEFTNAFDSTPQEIAAYVAAVLGLADGRDPLATLAATPAALRERLRGLADDDLGRREAPGKWAVRHVIAHLADAELVWGWRLRLVLAHDRPTLSGYDQDRWADALRYAEADVHAALEQFAVLRGANLRLLARASAEDLRRVGVHAERGEESLAHMIRLYAGHDLLHLRQIDRIAAAL